MVLQERICYVNEGLRNHEILLMSVITWLIRIGCDCNKLKACNAQNLSY